MNELRVIERVNERIAREWAIARYTKSADTLDERELVSGMISDFGIEAMRAVQHFSNEYRRRYAALYRDALERYRVGQADAIPKNACRNAVLWQMNRELKSRYKSRDISKTLYAYLKLKTAG